MPRPGPRPYECVRRAWHSDIYLPIRGSLIQEIFRLVNEVHKVETKKNKEWQEKLPIVVLKAEEIMYSKANSEAEYVDLKTLGARVHDAIDVIVRREESNETEKFLQPCIEAALHLGCIPRRSSRSQRENTPRYYLNPGTKVDHSVPPCNTNQATQIPYMLQNKNCSLKSLPCPSSNSNSFSVYPLYPGDQLQTKSSNLHLNLPTRPVEAKKVCVEKDRAYSKSPIMDSQETGPIGGCDLSLRLGPLVIENEYSFFPKAKDENRLNSSSTKRSNESELHLEDMRRKRKMIISPLFK